MLESYSILKNGNLKLSEHFKVREFFCRDGSDPVFIDTELVEILEKIPVIQNDIKVLGHRVTDLETHEHERS